MDKSLYVDLVLGLDLSVDSQKLKKTSYLECNSELLTAATLGYYLSVETSPGSAQHNSLEDMTLPLRHTWAYQMV